jgi:glycosyltransferase involved in cell wall biosynthesis
VTRVVLCVQNMSVPRDPRVWRQARTLRDAGYEVIVIAPRDPGQQRRERLEGVEILRFRAAGARGGIAGYMAETLAALSSTAILCLRLRRRGRIDVLHAANPPDTFFLVQLLLRPFGARFVFDQHDLSPELAQTKWNANRAVLAVLRGLERLSYATADLVLANNGSYRRNAIERGRADPVRVVVVRNGIDAVRPSVALRGSSLPLRVAFVGAMGNQDGVDVLLDAVAIAEQTAPGAIRLDMIGSGDHVASLQARARRLGIDHLVTWAGWLSGSAFQERLEAASVGVSPDLDDEFNRTSTMMKVADYLGAGLPCVVADLTENRVTAGDAALYFTPGDASDLARQLVLLSSDGELRMRLSHKALVRARALTWQHSAERMLAAYRWMLEAGPAVPGDQDVDTGEEVTLVS